jgi:hypothetical protein
VLAVALGAQLWRLHSHHPSAVVQEPATPSGALG